MSSLQQKHSSQIFNTLLRIKVISGSILSKQANRFTCHTEMPGISRFCVGSLWICTFAMNILVKLLAVWGGTDLCLESYPPLVPTMSFSSSLDINHEIWLMFSAVILNLQLLLIHAPTEECLVSLLYPEASMRTMMC